ncbi:MAG TPA: enoyl-CoA hydratase [Desulfotomaculum sp.]|nr:enoyl-CoA hydratase [Desulfotomaculum sp.]
MKKEKSKNFDEIRVGDKASTTKTFTEQDVCRFAEISGDYNPVHVDDSFAKNTRFKQRIVHGMLVASLLSNVAGTQLPGTGTIYLAQTLNFKAPVFLGDTISAEVEVIEKLVEKSRLKLKTICCNQMGTVVIEGEALVLVER